MVSIISLAKFMSKSEYFYLSGIYTLKKIFKIDYLKML